MYILSHTIPKVGLTTLLEPFQNCNFLNVYLVLVSFNFFLKMIFFVYCVIFYLQVRLTLGMYFVFLVDWLTVFDREQILVLRLEDYAANLKNTIRTVFDFLSVGVYPTHIKISRIWACYWKGLYSYFLTCHLLTGPLSEQVEAALSNRPMSNTRRVEDKNLGPMLPATRNLLSRFYLPFNSELSSVLNNSAFLWSYSRMDTEKWTRETSKSTSWLHLH